MDTVILVAGFFFLTILVTTKVLARLSSDISFIPPSTLKMHINKHNNFLIIDVRTPEEFIANHIVGALNLPLNNLHNNLNNTQQQLILCSTVPIVLICQSDRRSFSAAKLLKQAGFTDVSVVAGGMVRWISTGCPTENG